MSGKDEESDNVDPIFMGLASKRMQELHEPKRKLRKFSFKWFLRFFLVFSVLSGLAAGIYYTYMFGFNAGVNREPLVIVKAEKAPIKAEPKDPGGKQIPHQDKLIYGQLSSDFDVVNDGVLVDTYEQAQEKPKGSDPSPSDNFPVVVENMSEVNEGFTDSVIAILKNTDPPTASGAEAQNGQELNGQARPAKQTQEQAQAAAKPPQEDSAPAPKEQAQAAPQVSVQQPSPPKASSTKVAPKSKIYIQLGSLPTKQRAEREWQRLNRQYPDILSDFDYFIQEADLKNKGTFYRLLVGGFNSYTDAKKICQVLNKQEARCLVKQM